MKKVFAILLVLAVVAGCVFADTTTTTELHQMKVYSIVNEILPTFQLEYNGSSVTNAGKVNFTAQTTVPTNNTKETALNSNIDIGSETETNGLTVSFSALLVADSDDNLAKTKKSFKLTFSDGVFDEVKRKGSETLGTLAPGKIEVAAGSVGSTQTGITSITPTNTSLTEPYATVVFNGTTVSNAQTLATATYYYTGDPTIDMDTYYADILLTITNES